MAIFSLLCGAFGCRKAPDTAEHQISALTAVSVSCGQMDRSCGYSFTAHKEATGWAFDAECFTDHCEAETAFENRKLDSDDSEALLAMLEQNQSIAYAEHYRKPKKLFSVVKDDTSYCFCLTFSDGKQYLTYDRQSSLEEFFYRLAEKYDNPISKQ